MYEVIKVDCYVAKVVIIGNCYTKIQYTIYVDAAIRIKRKHE